LYKGKGEKGRKKREGGEEKGGGKGKRRLCGRGHFFFAHFQ